ncbi:MAG: hypothetical protein JSW60_05440 [Thermoplasmatales archaeon]|nr:MAG: hypothetical protein JSW60_05440 [Thermoplasmatales archaeon]
MLMISIIPLAAGMTQEEPEYQPEIDVGRVFLKGLLFRCNRFGNVNHALAIRLFYLEITPTERSWGWVTFNRVSFRDSLYMGRMWEVGMGLFTYVFGLYAGGLEIS